MIHRRKTGRSSYSGSSSKDEKGPVCYRAKDHFADLGLPVRGSSKVKEEETPFKIVADKR